MGNEEDSEKVLGIAPANSDVVKGLSEQDYEEVAKKISDSFGAKRVAFTLRTSISASENIWNGMVWEDGKACFSRPYRMNIVDRMGGGDSFGSGIIYSSLEGFDAQHSVDFAVAASCLKHSSELDFNLSSLEDVYQLMAGDGSGRIQR